MKRLGRFKIVEELGRGGMGTVYLARDPKIDRVVAIKTINIEGQSRGETKAFRERFFREAKAAGALSHPGIVTIYDVGEDETAKTNYIVMEYVEGKTLGEMAEGERLPFSTSLELVKQVAEALDYAHRHNIVHRDIKPANILVTPEGRAKITDFGIAKLEKTQLTQTGQVLGTPAYMSPEQLTGDPVDGRSDLFSLGVILYWLLTGQKPFPGETTSSVNYKIVYQDPVPPTNLDPSLSSDCDLVLQRALAKAPGKRFQSGREFAAFMEDLRAGRPLGSGADVASPGAVEETVVPRRAKPSRWGRLGASSLALILNLLLLDCAVETSLRGSPAAFWMVDIAVGVCLALTIWRWKKSGWLVKASISSLSLLGVLGYAAWQPRSFREEIVLLGQSSSEWLALITGGAIALAGMVLARMKFWRLPGRIAIVALTVYAVAAFLLGVASGRPYPDLYHGLTFWFGWPFWLQGAFIGSFILLPVAIASLMASGLFRIRRVNRRRRAYALAFLGIALSVSVAGFQAAQGPTLVIPVGAGHLTAFVSEESDGFLGIPHPMNQVRPETRKIYLILEGRGVGNLSVEAAWFGARGEGRGTGQKLGSSRLLLERGQQKTAVINAPGEGFLPGVYRVDLSAAGVAPQSLSFEIAPTAWNELIGALHLKN